VFHAHGASISIRIVTEAAGAMYAAALRCALDYVRQMTSVKVPQIVVAAVSTESHRHQFGGLAR
jgi:hypothetical protein